jgi:hypothetical protein
MSDEQEIKVRRRRVFHLHKKKRSYLTKNEDRVNLVPRYEDDRIKNTIINSGIRLDTPTPTQLVITA